MKKKEKQPKLNIKATKVLEFTSVLIGVLSLIMFTIFVFAHFIDKRAYNNNLSLSNRLHIDPPAEPYDYSTLIVGMLIILFISLLIIVICELSRNVYCIGKILEERAGENKPNNIPESKDQNAEVIQSAPPVITDTYCCPACGTVNEMPSRFCSGCGKQIF